MKPQVRARTIHGEECEFVSCRSDHHVTYYRFRSTRTMQTYYLTSLREDEPTSQSTKRGFFVSLYLQALSFFYFFFRR